jgi:hypothetical protein
MLDWSLLSGPIPVVLRVSAVVAAIWLLSPTLRARRQRWVKWVDLTACLLVAAVVTAVVAHLARNVWMLYPDNLAPAVYLWAGAGVFAVNLTVTRVVTERKVGRALVGLTAAVVVVGACANQVNTIYGAYVTPRDALHMVHPDDIALRDAPSHRQLPDADPVESRWSPPPGLTSQGKLTSAPIAAPQSGFTAREARVYLPPAYFADPQPQLPVMVLLAGQPGTPQDWLAAGKLVHIMDRFAADHRGMAPVVVVCHRKPVRRPVVPRFTTRKRRHLPRQGCASLGQNPSQHRSRPAKLGDRRCFLRRYLRAAIGHQPSRRVSHLPRHLRFCRTQPR